MFKFTVTMEWVAFQIPTKKTVKQTIKGADTVSRLFEHNFLDGSI